MRREIFTGLDARRDSWRHWFLPHHVWHFAFRRLWPIWWLDGIDDFVVTDRRHHVGLTFRLDAAVCFEKMRTRSGDCLRAVCRHARGCHRHCHLFQRRIFRLERKPAQSHRPGVKEFGHKPSTEMVENILGLDDQWKVHQVELDTNVT